MLYEFGACTLDTEKRLFARDSQAVALAPKTFDLLLLLVESGGRALSKAELMQALWPDTFVEEANLSFQISTLRKTLGEDGAKWIETVPKYGYRFAGAATLRDAAAVAARETPPPAERKRSLLYLVGALAAAAVIAVTVWTVRSGPAPILSGPLSPQPLTSHPGLQQQPSLSPDGSQVAYSWDGPNEDNFDIYVKLAGPGEPVRLTTNPAVDVAPAWSPDGRQIAFIRFASVMHGSIFLIPALSGAERKLADIVVQDMAHASRLSWSPDGQHIAFGGKLNDKGGSGIWLIPVDGTSQTRRLTDAGDSTLLDFSPAFSTDGRSLAFIRAVAHTSGDLHVQRLGEDLTPVGEPIPVTSDHVRIESVAWVNDRKLIYCTGSADELRRLKTIEIDAHGRPARPPQSAGFGDGAQSVSVSRNGNLIYSRQERDVNLWQIDVSGGEAGAEKLAASRYQSWTPAWSHDRRKIAFASTRSGMGEIWVADADGSRPIQITHMGGSNPRWSRDDRVILFNSWKPRSNLYTVDVADGSVTQLTHDDADLVEASWSRDGNWIYCGSNPFSGRREVSRLPASGGAPVPITKDGGVHAEESADGKWLYYSKNADSPTAIWKVPRNGGEETPVVDGLSYSINFAVTDKGIYFVSGRMARNSNAIEFFEFATGTRRVLKRFENAISWGIGLSPDYRSLVYAVVDHAASNLMLVENYR